MKKLNLLVMMFMMMVNMSFGQSILKGDMDDDGKLTIKDVTALVETINGKTAEKSIKVDTTPIKLASGESIWLSFENGVIKLNCSKAAPSVEVKGYYGWITPEQRDNLETFDASLFTETATTSPLVLTGDAIQHGKVLIIASPTSTMPSATQVQSGSTYGLPFTKGTTWEVNETITKDGKIWYVGLYESHISTLATNLTINF